MAVSTKAPFEVTDFSGGITDNVFSGETKTAEVMDNFQITPDGALESRAGSVVDDPAHSPLPLGNTRVGLLVNYARSEKLLAQTGRDFFYRAGNKVGVWNKITGPNGSSVLLAGTAANYVSTAEWNKQVFIVGDAFQPPMKIYKDSGGNYQVRNVGMPKVELVADSGITSAPGSANYVYAVIYRYEYTVGAQTFLELGPPLWLTLSGSFPIGPGDMESGALVNGPVTLFGFKPLMPLPSHAYDTVNVKLEIYRTVNNGVNFYRVAQLPADSTTQYVDNTKDSQLQTGVQLYTNDGTLDYKQAPPAKFMHVVGNVGLYGYTKDETGEHPFRLHQSVPGNPGFVPEITWVEVEDEIKGVSSVKSLPILLCKKRIYRVDGLFTGQGQGGMNPTEIHNSAGCVSHASAVEAENYLFWAGLDGFYASDGYQVIKISDHFNPRYAAMLKATPNAMRIQGKFDEVNRRVYWSVGTNASNLENDTLFCLDLRYGISPRSTFTTYSGKSFRPSAIEVFDGELYRGDNNGFVFRHGLDLRTDPRTDVSKSPDTWAEETIIWTLRTNHYNFGSAFFRKFVSRILLQASNAGNTTIQITANNDQGKRMRELRQIRWRRNIMWGDEAVAWGNDECMWAADGLIEQWRRFPAGGLRLSYLQLTFTNGLGVITASSTDGPCTLNHATKTAVLPNMWPSKSVDYFLKFSNDGYTRMFQVQAINASRDTVTLLDPAGVLPPSGSYEWELVGHAKGEPLSLIGYTLHWDNVDQNQGTFRRGDDGGN